MKRILSFFLAALLILSMGTNAFAAEKDMTEEKSETPPVIKKDDNNLLKAENFGAKPQSDSEEIWYFDYIHDFSEDNVRIFAPDSTWIEGGYDDFAIVFDEDVKGVRCEVTGDIVIDYEVNNITDEEPWEPIDGAWGIYVTLQLDANRTAKYKECSITVYNADNENESTTITIIVDVPIVDPDIIGDTGGSGYSQGIRIGGKGISSYYYEKDGSKFEMDYAYALPTELFERAVGRSLFVVDVDGTFELQIDKIESGQKGINFFARYEYMNAADDGGKIDDPIFVLDFFDKTPIKGKFTVSFDSGFTRNSIRNAFNKSSSDILTYYFIENYSETVKQVTFDYRTPDYDLDVWMVMNGEDSPVSDYVIKTDPSYVEGATTFDDVTGEELLWWEVSLDGTLTIGGWGVGYHSNWLTGWYPGRTSAPWGKYYEHINKVVICEGVLGMIGTFNGFTNIRKAILPESIEVLGYPLFPDSELRTLGPVGGDYDIEYSWTEEIPDHAFYEQDSLQSAVIHKGIKRIGDSALWCEGLEAVYFEGNAPEMFAADVYECSFKENVVFYVLEGKSGWETPYHMGYEVIKYNWINPGEPYPVDIEISSQKIPVGRTGTVSVNIPKNLGAEMIQFTLNYDSNLLSVESVSSPMFEEYVVNSADPGKIYFLWDAIEPINEAGSVLDIVFKAKDNIGPTQTAVSVDEDEDIIFVTGNYEEIKVEIIPGIIEITDVIYGDVNKDGKINVIDANLLRRHAAKLIELDEGQLAAADVDGNGKINVIDANLIRRYAAKIINQFPVELL